MTRTSSCTSFGERKYENAVRQASKSINVTRLSFAANDATCARNGNKFGRIDVGTIILTLHANCETRPRTENGNYIVHAG